jgi:hypothetical protein
MQASVLSAQVTGCHGERSVESPKKVLRVVVAESSDFSKTQARSEIRVGNSPVTQTRDSHRSFPSYQSNTKHMGHALDRVPLKPTKADA